jgi:hypothetical protein
MIKLLLMLLAVSILPFGMAYGENIAADGTASDTFSLSHVVARISTFTTKKLASVINDGTNIIGKFEVENNTSDGYKVNIKSANLGNMVPATTDDGEQNIPYVLNADKLDGEIGAGMEMVVIAVDLSLATGTDLIELGSGAEQTSATDASFKMTVSVDDADAMSMAGSYSDTITVTYTDL